MFLGRYSHQMDEKGRIRIPPKYKAELGEAPFITTGTNDCLFVYAQPVFLNKFLSKLTDIEISDLEEMDMARIIASNAINAEEDKQGRILLPKHLIDHAGLGKNLITIGALDHVEIWSEEAWEKYTATTTLDNVVKRIAEKRKKA